MLAHLLHQLANRPDSLKQGMIRDHSAAHWIDEWFGHG
jgi:hypothetical protein